MSDGETYECPTCGEEYGSKIWVSRHHNEVHGSKLGTTKVHVDCDNCSSTLERTEYRVEQCSHFFCDDDCKAEWQSRNLNGENNHQYNRRATECDWCGSQITRTKTELERSENQFCNKECHDAWQGENIPSGPESPRYEKVSVTCVWCGDQFERKPSLVEQSEHQFCSKACSNKWRSEAYSGKDSNNYVERITVTCSNCDDDLEYLPYRVEKQERFFCDKDCRREWQSENYRGENSPVWKGGWESYYGPYWDKQQEAARERDGYRCQSCGMDATEHDQRWNEKLHVHHIQPHRTFDDPTEANDLNNLVTLCRNCHHSKWEGIPLRPQLASAE